MTLNCTKADLEAASAVGLLDAAQLPQLMAFLQARSTDSEKPR